MNQYLILLDDDIFWQSRKEYLQLLELFINRSISIEEFIQQYGQRRRSNNEASEKRQKNLEAETLAVLPKASEIGFQLNPQSRGFTKILSSIDTDRDLFDPAIDFDMNLKHLDLIGYGISEEFLRFDIKTNFLPRFAN